MSGSESKLATWSTIVKRSANVASYLDNNKGNLTYITQCTSYLYNIEANKI